MKVLIPLDDGWIYPNPFVALQKEELEKTHGVNVVTGVHEFWDGSESFDIIHVYWPQCLVQESFSHKTIQELVEKIRSYKNRGVKIVSTALNMVAHYSENNKINESYAVIYKMSDMCLHLTDYSRNLFIQMYPNVIHKILPHHVYDPLYKELPDKKQSQRYLGLDSSKINILSFGTYRSDEERKFICKVADAVRDLPVNFIIPTYYRLPANKRFSYFKTKFKLWLTHILHSNIFCNGVYVDKDLTTYYSATDISFIQRIKILTSGNVPMGLFMGHVVVGTEDANVGCTLKETGNPTFNVANIDSVREAIIESIKLVKQGKGNQNRLYSLAMWNNAKITQTLFDYYKEICS